MDFLYLTSSKSQICPVLISILNFKELKENIPIGIFHGFRKSLSIELFLNPLIIDLLGVLDNGLTVNGLCITVNILNFSWDSPAKTFLLNVKAHNAYFGCTLCIEEGYIFGDSYYLSWFKCNVKN